METQSPIWGYVYDTTLVMAPGGPAEVDLTAALAPRIEPEIGFRLSTAVDPRHTDAQSLLHAIEWIAPCFEIIDCHFPQWKFKAADGIADFGVHYALVVGQPLRVDASNIGTLADALRDCTASLQCNGAVVEQGGGAATLGSPLNALAALAEVLARHPQSEPLLPGEIITTGTLTPPRDIAAGQRWLSSLQGIDLAPLELVLR
jgi:2-oxo-3-hexenedioate decarboxylase